MAWAWTGQPQVYSVTPLAATAGSEVTMRGGLVAPGHELELRWNGVAGPKLAETTVEDDGTFAMSFTLPADAEPGVHTVIAASEGVGVGVGVGRSAVEVVAHPLDEPAAAGDGFVAGEAPGLQAAEQSGTPAALIAGAALLTVGAVGLFGGFAVTTVQRRRALARSYQSQRF